MAKLNETTLDIPAVAKLYQALIRDLRETQEKEAPELRMPFFESRFPTASSFIIYLEEIMK